LPQAFERHRGAAASIRHIAAHEFGRALAAVDGAAENPADAVHEVRQRLKRLRALIRLARGHFAGFSAENIALRDLGRQLATTREADVLGETLDKLAEAAGIAPPSTLRAALIAAHLGRSDEAVEASLLRKVRQGLGQARLRAADWHFSAAGFDLIGPGVEATFRGMRSAGLTATAQTDALHLHEWRKQVKHHAIQLRYLRPVAPDWLGPRRDIADALADLLGEHHDLDMLKAALRDLPVEQGDGTGPVIATIEARSTTLEIEAFRLRDLLGDETPKLFRQRLEDAWRDWRD